MYQLACTDQKAPGDAKWGSLVIFRIASPYDGPFFHVKILAPRISIWFRFLESLWTHDFNKTNFSNFGQIKLLSSGTWRRVLDIWYVICLLTAFGLTPGGSSKIIICGLYLTSSTLNMKILASYGNFIPVYHIVRRWHPRFVFRRCLVQAYAVSPARISEIFRGF